MKSLIIYIILVIVLLSIPADVYARGTMKSKAKYVPDKHGKDFSSFLSSFQDSFQDIIGAKKGNVILSENKSEKCNKDELKRRIYRLDYDILQSGIEHLKLQTPPNVLYCKERHDICMEFEKFELKRNKKQYTIMERYRTENPNKKDELFYFKQYNINNIERNISERKSALQYIKDKRTISSYPNAIALAKNVFQEDFVDISRLLGDCYNIEDYLQDTFGKLEEEEDKGDVFPTLVKRGFEIMKDDIQYLMFTSLMAAFHEEEASDSGKAFATIIKELIMNPIIYEKSSFFGKK